MSSYPRSRLRVWLIVPATVPPPPAGPHRGMMHAAASFLLPFLQTLTASVFRRFRGVTGAAGTVSPVRDPGRSHLRL